MEFFKYSDVLSIKQKNHVIACYFKKYEKNTDILRIWQNIIEIGQN